MMVRAHHPRGGFIRGAVVRTLSCPAYGTRIVILGAADHTPGLLMEFTVSVDDVVGA